MCIYMQKQQIAPNWPQIPLEMIKPFRAEGTPSFPCPPPAVPG